MLIGLEWVSSCMSTNAFGEGLFLVVCLFLASSYLSFLVPDSSVEVFPLQTDEVVSRVDDATFSGDGSGCIDVVTSHHPYRDTRTLTLPNGVRHLRRIKHVLTSEPV